MALLAGYLIFVGYLLFSLSLVNVMMKVWSLKGIKLILCCLLFPITVWPTIGYMVLEKQNKEK